MAKIRVHELAKELNINSKEIIEKAKTINIELANHMSSIGEIDAEKITNLFKPTVKAVLKPAKKPEVLPKKEVTLPVTKKLDHKHDHKTTEYQHRNDAPIDKHHANPSIIEKDEKGNTTIEIKHVDVKKDKFNKYKPSIPGNYKPVTLDLSKKEHKKSKYNKKKDDDQEEIEELEILTIGDEITVKDLADKLGKPSVEIIKYLMTKDVFANINQSISFDVAAEVAESYDILIERKEIDEIEEIVYCEDLGNCELSEKPPVVVVMGHVDHGKTSLLDAIRETQVTVGEHGGITQHIGASQVEINNKKITFLDTPGHEAFTAMRLRGAKVTDIAILVVAADDGVMPQTAEAINHAKAADVPIIVAINKIDKPGANPEKVKQELTEYGLVSEEWGGETICVPVSAITREGIDTLLEMVLLVAEMKEFKAAYDTRAKGTVIEARLDKSRGIVATLLVANGTLRVGDPILAGKTCGKVKAMLNSEREKIKYASPSMPVEILGFNSVPEAGDTFYVTKDDKQAKYYAEKAAVESREKRIVGAHKNVSLDALFDQIKTGEIQKLNVIIKADVQGSVEAIRQSLQKLSNADVIVTVIHGGAGAVTESDVMLAAASSAIVIAFNVVPQAGVRKFAEENLVDLRQYRVIYNVIEDVEAAMKGMLAPEFKEKVIGQVEVRDTFKVTNVGMVAGGFVRDGYITRNATIRVVREGIIIFEGAISSLKRFKDDVKEVKTGFECGVLIEKFSDIKAGDSIEAYIMEEIKRS
ncbi:MAG TPA: translation initiation factor IF-2 [Clostridiales bacterium]|nr:MAG: translation initiation factor IF-2 [Clostridiales bacterium GWD2_32_59]HAN10398.1 translation initiation factor IF-2 [Clostridiales bacterium]